MSKQLILVCHDCGVTYEDDGDDKCRNCDSTRLQALPLSCEFLPEEEE